MVMVVMVAVVSKREQSRSVYVLSLLFIFCCCLVEYVYTTALLRRVLFVLIGMSPVVYVRVVYVEIVHSVFLKFLTRFQYSSQRRRCLPRKQVFRLIRFELGTGIVEIVQGGGTICRPQDACVFAAP